MPIPYSNPLLQKLRAGETVISLKVNLDGCRALELAALCGVECLWLDMEHTATDWLQLEHQMRAARSRGAACMVRVERGSYSDLIRPFELDADAVLVPHVMGSEDARQLVRQMRFHPEGLRALDGGNADGLYTLRALPEYLAGGNRERLIGFQVEDPEALEDIETMAAVPGYDMLFFGPGDFSQAIGCPGELNHPRVVDARKRVAQAARAHGKFAATVGPPSTVPEYQALGYQFLNVGADVFAISQYCNRILAEVAEHTGKASTAVTERAMYSK